MEQKRVRMGIIGIGNMGSAGIKRLMEAHDGPLARRLGFGDCFTQHGFLLALASALFLASSRLSMMNLAGP